MVDTCNAKDIPYRMNIDDDICTHTQKLSPLATEYSFLLACFLRCYTQSFLICVFFFWVQISNMKKEINSIRVKDISQGGLTQGQQTQIARNEQRMAEVILEKVY